MKTLKEARTQFGLRQADVAAKIGTNNHDISNYENGLAVPDLEDMVILEQQFGQKIDWGEPLNNRLRHNIMQDVITLSERFPLVAVFSFAVKALKEGIRIGSPGSLIAHYARVSGDAPDALYPPDVKDG